MIQEINLSITNKVLNEISLLNSMYLCSIYSFENTIQMSKLNIHKYKLISGNEKFYINKSTTKELSFPSIYVLIHNLKSKFPGHLRELLLIRLISIIEVYFIDALRELFIYRKDLFYALDKKMELPYYNLLSADSISQVWSMLINKECRHLQNSGFEAIWKYYKNKLDIDFGESHISVSEIKKMYDIRHLLVHKLGVTDEKFKEDYDTSLKKITLSEEELFNYLNNVRTLTIFLDEKISILIQNTPKKIKYDDERLKLTLQVIDKENTDYIFSKSYSFFYNETLYILKDLIEELKFEENIVKINLRGNYEVLMYYVREIKKLSRNSKLVILEKLHKECVQGMPIKINDKELDLVKKLLPEKPWPKGIHKDIAKELKLSNSKASKIISFILLSE